MKAFGKTMTAWLALGALASTLTLAPADAQAQNRASQRRQETKNEWRNLAIGSGVIALLGLLENDSTLTFVGSAGALYSAYRYEQDRKSQSRIDRARAAIFSRSYFVRDGYKYTRKTKWKGGKKYFYFVKSRLH